MHRIFRDRLQLHAYKVQLVQKLQRHDSERRPSYSKTFLRQFQGTWATNGYRPIMSDQAHFHLGVFVNKQDCRIWVQEHPHSHSVAQAHPQKVTVWCGVTHDCVIRPHSFENQDGTAATVNGERYRHMPQTVVKLQVEQLRDKDGKEIWFQQDGATCHTARETMHALREIFSKHISPRTEESSGRQGHLI